MKKSLFFFVLFAVMVSWACREKITVYPPPPPPIAPSPQSGAASLPEKPTNVPAGSLEMGEINFREGKYPEAVRDYEAYLKENPGTESRDRILFNIGLSRALSASPGQPLSEASGPLKQLVVEFPESQYKSQAELILNLIARVAKLNLDVSEQDSRIRRLQEELKRLKEIDLNRRPSRPNE